MFVQTQTLDKKNIGCIHHNTSKSSRLKNQEEAKYFVFVQMHTFTTKPFTLENQVVHSHFSSFKLAISSGTLSLSWPP
jgi:hypothetical protein